MKNEYRRTLETYGAQIKQSKREAGSTELDERIKQGVIELAALADAVPIEAEERVYRLQERKQEIMAWLKSRIREIDEKKAEGRDPSRRFVRMEGEHLVWQRDDGTAERLTLGEVLADVQWGVPYQFDTSVMRNVQKRYVVEEAKAKLRSLLNYQIAAHELNSKKNDEEKLGGMKAILTRTREGRKKDPGEIAETLLQSFLEKISADHHLAVRVLPADIYQDVVEKIDFIIERKQYFRGVHVESQESVPGRLGIQFTVARSSSIMSQKRKKLAVARTKLQPEDRLSDILLVRVKARGAVKKAYEAWEKDPVPGGPDAYLTVEMRERLFKAVFEHMIPEKTLDEIWGEVKTTLRTAV